MLSTFTHFYRVINPHVLVSLFFFFQMWLLHLRACIADSALRLTSREAALVSNNSSSAAQVVQNKSVYGATQYVYASLTTL